jgi:hypothetical protein
LTITVAIAFRRSSASMSHPNPVIKARKALGPLLSLKRICGSGVLQSRETPLQMFHALIGDVLREK